jgi:hypothetical protein
MVALVAGADETEIVFDMCNLIEGIMCDLMSL